MKTFLKLILLVAISLAIGNKANKDLVLHYSIEEYYLVQNLSPNNEKDAEGLRHEIQALIQKTIPPRYHPKPDHFQCFKIISEAVLFCSADTYSKNQAQHLKKLLQITVPQEIGWIPLEAAQAKVTQGQADTTAIEKTLKATSNQLTKLQATTKKNSTDEKKFLKVDALYKKNNELLGRKVEILNTMLSHIANPDLKTTYQFKLEDAQSELERYQSEYDAFAKKNKAFSDSARNRDELQQQVDDLKKALAEREVELKEAERALSRPNPAGKIADQESFQLVPDPSREKFEAESRPTNILWFSIVAFLILSNFVLPIRPIELIAFDEATQTEALLR